MFHFYLRLFFRGTKNQFSYFEYQKPSQIEPTRYLNAFVMFMPKTQNLQVPMIRAHD